MQRDGAVHFHAKVAGNGVLTDGPSECTLGWPLDPEPGREREGLFCSWSWDGNLLTVRNDRYGIYPLFYYRREGEICLSPSIFRLIERGAPADFDFRALSVFLRFESFLGEDTPFKHIRMLPPNCLLEWSKDRFSLSGERVRGRAGDRSIDEAVEEYQSLFTQAMARRLPEPPRFTVMLSGGKDSRHILMELREQGHEPPFCVTSRYFSPLETLDVDLASRVTACIGQKHYIIDPGLAELRAELWRNGIANFGSLESGWMHGLVRFLEGRIDTIYDGLGGDLLSDDCFCTKERFELFRARRFDELADRTLGVVDVEKFAVPELHGHVAREEAVAHMAREMRKYEDDPDPVNSFYFWNRTRRMVSLSPVAILGHFPHVHCPYLDHRLYDFLSSVTSEFKLQNDLHGDTVRRSYPAIGHLPFTPRHYDYGPHGGTERRFALDFVLYLLRRRPNVLRYRYIVPRLARSLFDRKDAASSRWLIKLALYLCQLDELAAEAGAAFEKRRIGCDER